MKLTLQTLYYITPVLLQSRKIAVTIMVLQIKEVRKCMHITAKDKGTPGLEKVYFTTQSLTPTDIFWNMLGNN